jgi:hypothetical protein
LFKYIDLPFLAGKFDRAIGLERIEDCQEENQFTSQSPDLPFPSLRPLVPFPPGWAPGIVTPVRGLLAFVHLLPAAPQSAPAIRRIWIVGQADHAARPPSRQSFFLNPKTGPFSPWFGRKKVHLSSSWNVSLKRLSWLSASHPTLSRPTFNA